MKSLKPGKRVNKKINISKKSITFTSVCWLIKTCLLISFVMITSGYVLSTTAIGSKFYLMLTFPILVFLFETKIKDGFLFRLNGHSAAYAMLVFLSVASFIINNNVDYYECTIKFLLVVTFAYLFTNRVSFGSFAQCFVATMKGIVVISLIGYVLINYAGVSINLPTVVNVNDINYGNGIIYFYFQNVEGGLARNLGCFWEPGVFATFIVIAIIFDVSIIHKGRLNKANLTLFMLGILSTQSTYAYLAIVLIPVLIMSDKIKGVKAFIVFFVVFSLVLIVYQQRYVLVDLLVDINPKVFYKLQDNTTSVSVDERFACILANLKVFFMYPVFGAGIGNADIIINSILGTPQTSTSTYYLAAFGIWGSLYTIWFAYGIMNYKKWTICTRFIVLFTLLLQINKESQFSFTATYIIMFYFLKDSSYKDLVGRVYPYPLSRQKPGILKVDSSPCVKAVGTEGARRATGVPTATPYTSAGVW